MLLLLMAREDRFALAAFSVKPHRRWCAIATGMKMEVFDADMCNFVCTSTGVVEEQ